MRPGRLLVASVAAGLVTLILLVGHPNFRHPGLTTRRLRDDADREDYKFLENVKNAGGYPAFVEARVEVAVLAELMSRGGKLPDELICVAVEFLGLELPRWKPAPKKQ